MRELETYKPPQERQREFFQELDSGMRDINIEQTQERFCSEAKTALLALDNPNPKAVRDVLNNVYKQFNPQTKASSQEARDFRATSVERLINWLETLTGSNLRHQLQAKVEKAGAKGNPWKEFYVIASGVLSSKSNEATAGTEDLAKELNIAAEDLVSPDQPAPVVLSAESAELDIENHPLIQEARKVAFDDIKDQMFGNAELNDKQQKQLETFVSAFWDIEKDEVIKQYKAAGVLD